MHKLTRHILWNHVIAVDTFTFLSQWSPSFLTSLFHSSKKFHGIALLFRICLTYSQITIEASRCRRDKEQVNYLTSLFASFKTRPHTLLFPGTEFSHIGLFPKTLSNIHNRTVSIILHPCLLLFRQGLSKMFLTSTDYKPLC